MTEEEEEGQFSFSDQDESTDVPDVNPFNVSEMSFAAQNFKDQTPDLVTLAKASSNQSLLKIASNLHSILSQEGYVKSSQEARHTIEECICKFTHQLVKEAAEKARGSTSSNAGSYTNNANNDTNDTKIKQQDNQISSLREEVNEWKTRAISAEKSADDARGNYESCKEDYESVHAELQNANLKILKLNRDNDQSTSLLKNQVDSLEDNLRHIKDKLSMSESSISRLQQQLNESNQELSTAKADLALQNSKLKSKDDKIEKLNNDIIKLKTDYENKDAENQQLIIDRDSLESKLQTVETTLQATDVNHLEELEKQNKQLTYANEQLSNMCQDLTKDLSDTQALHQQSNDLLQQQLNLIAQYDSEFNELEIERKDLANQSDADGKLITTLQERAARLENENSSLKSDESKNALVQIKKMLKPRFGDDDVVETVKGLLSGSTDTEMKEKNDQLFQLCEGILKFWERFVNSNELKATMVPDSTGDRLAKDRKFCDSLLTQIARCRQMAINNSGYEASSLPTTDAVQKQLDRLQKSEDDVDKEIFLIISTTTLASKTLRKLYDRSSAVHANALSQLQSVADIVNFEGGLDADHIEALPEHIVDKLLRFKAFQQKICDIFDPIKFDQNDFDETLDYVFQYIKNSAVILNSIDTDLRQAVSFDGELSAVTPAAVEYILQLEQDQALSRTASIQEVSEELETVAASLREERQKANRALGDLENERQSNGAQIESLMKENERLAKENDEIKTKLEQQAVETGEVRTKYEQSGGLMKSLEEDNESLRNENAGLRAAMEKKSKLFDERIEKLMNEERAQHREDMERQESRTKKRVEMLEASSEAKSQKIKKLKAKTREILTEYESAFKKQKEATANYKQQAAALKERLNGKAAGAGNGAAGANKEADRLRADVKTLETERLILATKLKQAQENAEKVQAVRDNYWMAQMTVREGELNKSINDAVADANDRYENFLDQVVNLLEPYLPVQTRATEETTVETLNNVIQRLEQAESLTFNNNSNHTANNKNNGISRDGDSPSSVKSEADISLSKARAALQEWDRWGRDLFVFVTDGEVPCQSNKELRYVISEMVFASIANRKVVYKLESLKAQKKFLLKWLQPHEEAEEQDMSLRHLIVPALFAIRIMKKAGHYLTHYSEPKATPIKGTPKKATPKKSPGTLF